MVPEIHFFDGWNPIKLGDCFQPVELEVIRNIYDEISKDPHFPNNCGDAARALDREGFPIQSGRFITDYPEDFRLVPERNYRIHKWNRTGRIFIDLVAFQFNPYLYGPLRLPEGIMIFDQSYILSRRYLTEGKFRKRFPSSSC